MFLEEKKDKISDQKEVFGQRSEIHNPNSNIFILLGGITIIILLCALLYISFFQKPGNNYPTIRLDKNISSSTSGKLPADDGVIDSDEYNFGSTSDNLIAENISFGYFYEKPKNNNVYNLTTYDLPINIKTDVNNYYDVSRKINLDDYLNDLNNYGFAVLDKQKEIEDKDFFSTYQDLTNKDLPIVITNDFIFYYYQNTLKDVYKEIEKNVFYEHVWRLNKSLYDIALARYKKTALEVGAVNDPVLEGQRMQLAFFTMVLKLLMPTKAQIVEDVNFSDPNKFTVQEAEAYGFVVPDFLQADIERELNLITFANKKEKSPIMLYPFDYKKFSVPENYRVNAKLNNFYLTLGWLKTVFPLYYQNSDCENCLLDKNDWVLNMYAAGRTAKDLYDNQELKNQWAIIYKFISFFSGLRQDMTYLNYHAAFLELFGNNYDLEKIFSLTNSNRDDDMRKIQEKISQFRFSAIEGGIDRVNNSLTPNIGMRILQEDYWPNDYIFKELSGDKIRSSINKISGNIAKTACASKTGGIYRCSGFGYDIINLIQPISQGSQYFLDNTDYSGYEERLNSLRKEMSYFNQNTWNNNIYWMTLDILKPLLENYTQNKSVYASSYKWQQEKDYQTALGAWVNLHLTEDIVALYSDKEEGGNNLGLYNHACNLNNYIELNTDFMEELIARNMMLLKMLNILKVDKDTNAASLELKDLNIKLQQLVVIAKKLLNNQVINDDDCRVLDDFARRNIIEKRAKKSFSINSTDKISTQSIENNKLLAIIYNKGNEKVLVFGPMFNYKE